VTSGVAISSRAHAAIPASARAECLATLEHHSKSFALAGKLLPEAVRGDSAAVYAWCRHVDDAVDLVAPEQQADALARLERELSAVYAGAALPTAQLSAFQQVVFARGIPEHYPRELLAGMRMDVQGVRYETLDDLLEYCHRVAGVVGLMMCHVLGVRDEVALRNAAHLGIGMQLTNICRDVLEDWGRGRLYLPSALLAQAGAPGLERHVGGSFPGEARAPVGRVVRELLHAAEAFYASGDGGLVALDARAAFAVRTARLVYSDIGARIGENGYDVLAGRAVVPKWRKLALAVRAFLGIVYQAPARVGTPFNRTTIESIVRFPDDVLPL